jgi:hypothetical protein
MKTLLTLFLLSSLLANAQTQEQRNFGIAEVFRGGDSIFIKKLRTVVVNVSEGKITKMRTPPDSATLFIAPDGLVYEGTTVWRKVGTVPVVNSVVDNNDTRNVYSTGWLREAGKTWTVAFLNDDFHFATTVNASVSLTFTGNKIKWICEKRNNHGIAKVLIDNVDQGNIDMYKNSTANVPELVFEKSVTQGQHTIKVQLIGPSTQAAGSLSIVHDRFEIESAQ